MSLISALPIGIAALSAYCLARSAQSIPKLQRYEDSAKKAARWSNAADKRLWDTRYTVGAGFIVVSLQFYLVRLYKCLTAGW